MAIALSAHVRSNLLALQQIASNMAVSQQRLATGKRVNSARDNPTSYFTAATLNARAGALATIADDIGTSRKVLETASMAIDSMLTMINSARDLARRALAAPSTLAQVTSTVAGQTAATPIVMDAGDTITVSDGTTTATYTHAPGQDVQDFIDAVNNTAGLNIEAALSGGRLVLSATTNNSIIIAGSADSNELAALGLVTGTTAGSISPQRQALAEQFDAVRTQIEQLAADAGFNGQNLLGGSTLVVRFNESGSSQLTVTGSTMTAASLGINSATAAGGNFQHDANVMAFLGHLDGAATQLEAMSVNYASKAAQIATRETFTREMVGLFNTGADNLVLADTNEEGANILALRARQQLAGTALSLASKAQASVLRLFGL